MKGDIVENATHHSSKQGLGQAWAPSFLQRVSLSPGAGGGVGKGWGRERAV